MQEIKECLACGGVLCEGLFRVKVGKPFTTEKYAGRVCKFNKHDPKEKPCINPYCEDKSKQDIQKLKSGYPTEEGLDTKSIEVLTEILPEYGIFDDPKSLFD